MTQVVDKIAEYTPVESRGGVWLKRDDTFQYAGQRGGKVRSCLAIMEHGLADGAVGVVTAGSRHSPQVNIVAHLAQDAGIPCRVHVPSGPLGAEVLAAAECGAEVVQHRPGYNTVIVARARADSEASGWLNVPFGMECWEAVHETAGQVGNLPILNPANKIVVPVGSGMTLAGILTGLEKLGFLGKTAIIGVMVGADPTKRLAKYAPAWSQSSYALVRSEMPYETHVQGSLGGVQLDEVYEAKCLPYLNTGDLLWLVGHR